MQKKCFVIEHCMYAQRTYKKLQVYIFNIFAVHQLKPAVCCIIIISPFQHFIKSERAFNLSMYSPPKVHLIKDGILEGDFRHL